MLQESSLSFEVPKISALRENNETIIFATLVLPMNLTRVNQVYQVETVNGDDDSLGMHALSGDNIKWVHGETRFSLRTNSTSEPIKEKGIQDFG